MGRIISGEEARRYLQENQEEKPPKKRIISGDEAKKYLEENDTEKPGILKSAAIGFAQGATGENAPEISAGIQAGAGSIGQEVLGENDEGINLPQYDVLKKYKELKKKNRATAEGAKEENPWAYGGSNLVGNVALSSAVPGGYSAKLAAPSFLQAFGESKNTVGENPAGLAWDTAKGGVIGTAAGAVIGKAGEKILNKAASIGRAAKNKLPEYAYKLPHGLGEKYYKYRPELEKSPTKGEFALDLSDKLKGLGEKSGEFKHQALESLRNVENKSVDPKEVSNIFQDILSGIEKKEGGLHTSEPLQNTKKELEKLRDIYRNTDKPVSLERVEDELQNVRQGTNYDSPYGKSQDTKVWNEAYGKVGDLLKNTNKGYEDNIAGSKKYLDLSKEAAEDLGGEEFKPKHVLSSIKDIASGGEKNPAILRTAEKIGSELGIDIKRQSDISTIKDAVDRSGIFDHGFGHFLDGIVIRSIPRISLGVHGLVDDSISIPAAEKVKRLVEIYKDKSPEVIQLQISKLMDAASRGDKSSVLALQILKQFQESEE